MSIEFPCPQCGRQLRTPDGSEGKRAKCPSCETVSEIPSSPATAPSGADPFDNQGGTSENPFAGSSGPPANPFASESAPSTSGGYADPSNPYASPLASESTGEVHHTALQRRQIDFGEVGSESWRLFSDNFGQMILAGLVIVGIWMGWNIAQNIISTMIQAALGMGGNQPFGGNQFNPNAGPGAAFGGGGGPTVIILFVIAQMGLAIIGMAVWSYIQAGMIKYTLAVARGNPPDVGMIFTGGKYVLPLFGFWVMYTIATYVVIGFVVGLGVGGAFALGEDYALLVIIPVVLVTIAIMLVVIMFTFVPYFIVDRDEGVFNSIGRSWHFMTGNFLTTFGLFLVFGFLSVIVVFVTCCLGYLGVMPFMFLMPTVMYLMATGQYRGARA